MERRDIEVFLALAEELHFGRTAERLHVSQARVSQTIAALERRFGAALFARSSRRVALTPLGARLRDDLAPAFARIEGAVARAVAAGRGLDGELPVAFEAPGVADLIRPLLEAYRTPDRSVAVREADFTDVFASLRAGEVDALVTLLPVAEPDLVVGPELLVEPMVLAVATGHPFARRDHVTLDDLARDTVLRAARPAPAYWRDPPAPWTTARGAPITRGPTFATFQELLAAVAAGTGVCPLAAHAADYFTRPTVRFVPFRDAPPVAWALVWRAGGATARVTALAALAAAAP
ncbi:LysR family transcriptional regulator [Pseudonocardia humida]|uniref:LysR family transcriptional regulator n=1 Tax=Pseudonocardia humida TaxID=2800819 RepID=A0ABT1A0M1_9PSEU|nr:LysR family transcriptional regulator [Pseudonocardia humida]MCO1656552.1 LysR family transcriptional regulator [Pseudonocardia humida]